MAFFLDSPRIVQCFRAAAGPNPEMRKAGPALALEYLVEDRTSSRRGTTSPSGSASTDTVTGCGKGLTDVTLISFRARGGTDRQTVARDVGGGGVRGDLNFREAGAYYVYVTVPSLKIGFRDFVHLSLVVRRRGRSRSEGRLGRTGRRGRPVVLALAGGAWAEG